MEVFHESSFFKEQRAPALPTPEEVRAINESTGHVRSTNFNRPPPVIVPSLGLVVKYGADVTIVEAQTQMMVREQLQDRVPVPEVFGWAEDGDQRFIYMSLIQGETLGERWPGMNEIERKAVCEELKQMVNAWRTLKYGGHNRYVGPNPKVAAVIDWGQAGWYPAYWEYCKARRVTLDPEYLDSVSQEDWHERYLPMIIDPVDEKLFYHPWLYFVLSKGI
ncbi:hypothetical protein DL763_010230 [Monosporascus cannonballus]|nr:hypothetical protein DL763_010230 [Monosporascus cannonballus]